MTSPPASGFDASAVASPACLPRLILVCGRASRGDVGAIEQIRMLGEVLAFTGGLSALVRLQAALHDHAFRRWGRCARADLIGTWWGHIPEWTAAAVPAGATERPPEETLAAEDPSIMPTPYASECRLVEASERLDRRTGSCSVPRQDAW